METSPQVMTYMWQGVSPSPTSCQPGPRVLSSALLVNLANYWKESLAKKGIFSNLLRMYSCCLLLTASLARLIQMLCTLSSLTLLMAASSVSPSSKSNTSLSLMLSSMNCCYCIAQICFFILHFPRIIMMEQDSTTSLKCPEMSCPGQYSMYQRGGTLVRGQLLKGQS